MGSIIDHSRCRRCNKPVPRLVLKNGLCKVCRRELRLPVLEEEGLNDSRLAVRWANFLAWSSLEHTVKTCPKCEGRGWNPPNPKDYEHYSPGPIWWVENCGECHGEGFIREFAVPYEEHLQTWGRV